jgi:hypothetical protein
MRSYHRRLWPTLQRYVRAIQSGLHVRFCTYFDTGADGDTDGPGVEVPAIVSPAMLLIKWSEPDGQRNQHTFKSHKRSGDSVTEGSDPCGKARLGCSQPSMFYNGVHHTLPPCGLLLALIEAWP